MSAIAQLLGQPVTEEEIGAACASLGLPVQAFHGPDDNDARLDVLRSNASIDVSACPGSGKTTLLVAKLAILAKRWTSPSAGICVLSHTNVARLEIENRLGASTAGRSILSYPHFIGTIHGFVNQFVALPWLRSQGIDVVAIDDDICLRRRLHKLPHAQRTRVIESKRGEICCVSRTQDMILAAFAGAMARSASRHQHTKRSSLHAERRPRKGSSVTTI